MLVFKCDRCGTITEDFDAYARVEIYSSPMELDGETYCLCEQCYQTIKEVLEDGEIK